MLFRSTEYYAKAHQLTKQEAATQIQKIDQLAADIDLPIKMENAIPVNTLAAHRLIKYIESLNSGSSHPVSPSQKNGVPFWNCK